MRIFCTIFTNLENFEKKFEQRLAILIFGAKIETSNKG
jgi:hypothetical protein